MPSITERHNNNRNSTGFIVEKIKAVMMLVIADFHSRQLKNVFKCLFIASRQDTVFRQRLGEKVKHRREKNYSNKNVPCPYRR
jgi:hypothetical protein